MAKQVTAVDPAAVPRRAGDAGSAGRARPRRPRRQHRAVRVAVQRPHQGQSRHDRAGRHPVYTDRTFTFEIKSPPAAVLLKQAAGIPLEKKKGGEVIPAEEKTKGSGKYKGFKVTKAQVATSPSESSATSTPAMSNMRPGSSPARPAAWA